MVSSTTLRMGLILIALVAVTVVAPTAAAGTPSVPVHCNPSYYHDRLGLGHGVWLKPTEDGCTVYWW